MFNGGAEGVADEFIENPPVEGAEGGTAAGVEGVVPKEKEAAGAEGVVVDGCAGVGFPKENPLDVGAGAAIVFRPVLAVGEVLIPVAGALVPKEKLPALLVVADEAPNENAIC